MILQHLLKEDEYIDLFCNKKDKLSQKNELIWYLFEFLLVLFFVLVNFFLLFLSFMRILL